MVAAAIASASACATPSDSQGVSIAAILGGAPAEPGAWPNVGILDSGCSAILLHPKLIVYAAHCAARPEHVWFGERFDVSVDSASRTVRVAPSGKAYSVATERCEAHPEGMIGNGLEVEAEDRESGVQRVEVEWLNAQGETLGRLEDELAPYRFKLESDSEVDRIEATALDFAGNTTQIEWPPAPATNGCSVGPGPAAKGASQMRFGLLCALLVLLVARRRRRIAHAQLGDGPR